MHPDRAPLVPGHLPRLERLNEGYADPACTVRAWASLGDCGQTHVVEYDAETACAGKELAAVYRLGDALDTVYVLSADDSCVAVEAFTGRALEPIPFEAFARLEEVLE